MEQLQQLLLIQLIKVELVVMRLVDQVHAVLELMLVVNILKTLFSVILAFVQENGLIKVVIKIRKIGLIACRKILLIKLRGRRKVVLNKI
jgi:hypothetical protein